MPYDQVTDQIKPLDSQTASRIRVLLDTIRQLNPYRMDINLRVKSLSQDLLDSEFFNIFEDTIPEDIDCVLDTIPLENIELFTHKLKLVLTQAHMERLFARDPERAQLGKLTANQIKTVNAQTMLIHVQVLAGIERKKNRFRAQPPVRHPEARASVIVHPIANESKPTPADPVTVAKKNLVLSAREKKEEIINLLTRLKQKHLEINGQQLPFTGPEQIKALVFLVSNNLISLSDARKNQALLQFINEMLPQDSALYSSDILDKLFSIQQIIIQDTENKLGLSQEQRMTFSAFIFAVTQKKQILLNDHNKTLTIDAETREATPIAASKKDVLHQESVKFRKANASYQFVHEALLWLEENSLLPHVEKATTMGTNQLRNDIEAVIVHIMEVLNTLVKPGTTAANIADDLSDNPDLRVPALATLKKVCERIRNEYKSYISASTKSLFKEDQYHYPREVDDNKLEAFLNALEIKRMSGATIKFKALIARIGALPAQELDNELVLLTGNEVGKYSDIIDQFKRYSWTIARQHKQTLTFDQIAELLEAAQPSLLSWRI